MIAPNVASGIPVILTDPAVCDVTSLQGTRLAAVRSDRRHHGYTILTAPTTR